MRNLLSVTAAFLLTAASTSAIPQNFGGNFFGATFQPKDIDEDLTDELLAAEVWQGGKLPRIWQTIPSLDGNEVKLFTVNPMVFGERPAAVFANTEKGKLQSIAALYLDAGHFFGYRPGRGKDDIKTLQRDFKKRYTHLEKVLGDTLGDQMDDGPDDAVIGRTALLRNTYQDYRLGNLTLRFSAIENHSISLIIVRTKDIASDYLDDEIAALDKRQRRQQLLANVQHHAAGDITIGGIPMFRQGLRPYCAVSTLGMATHYLGLRMNTDALAAGARFRNTGSAKGSKILDLYRAAAQEADASVQRSGSFDFKRAKKYLEKGFPVVVWRRYSSERNRLHSAAANGTALPETNAADRASWPTSKTDPGHASVVTGFNEKTGEIIFMESWGEHTRGKRMHIEELEATSYAAFYFKI
ncbi:MAG: C39 family peptidase [Verrucomicrobiales bacterium]